MGWSELKYDEVIDKQSAEIEALRAEVERLRAALIALLAQMDRDVGRLRQGKLSDLRIEAAALVGYEGLGERN